MTTNKIPFLVVEGLTVRLNSTTLLNNISFTINNGEAWAITGPSGSGKTTLLKTIAGKLLHTGRIAVETERLASKKIVLVEQQHHFKNLSNTNSFYYQQRFNSMDAEDAITVEEDLKQAATKTHASQNELDELATLFDIKKLFTERLIQLSNGENKRLQIVKALLLHPTLLLLDNPFTGLDVESRKSLEDVLTVVINKGVHVIVVTSSTHVPAFITNVLSLTNNGFETYDIKTSSSYLKNEEKHFQINDELLRELTKSESKTSLEFMVKMKNVEIKYDGKKYWKV